MSSVKTMSPPDEKYDEEDDNGDDQSSSGSESDSGSSSSSSSSSSPSESETEDSDVGDNDDDQELVVSRFAPKTWIYYSAYSKLRVFPRGETSTMFPPARVMRVIEVEETRTDPPKNPATSQKVGGVAVFRMSDDRLVVETLWLWRGEVYTTKMIFNRKLSATSFNTCLRVRREMGDSLGANNVDLDADDGSVLFTYELGDDNEDDDDAVPSITEAKPKATKDAAPNIQTRSEAFPDYGQVLDLDVGAALLPVALQRVTDARLGIVDVSSVDDTTVEWLETTDGGKTAYAVRVHCGDQDAMQQLVAALNKQMQFL